MKFAVFLLIAGILPAFADGFEDRWSPEPPQCTSIDRINSWISDSNGAFANLRTVNGAAIPMLGNIFDLAGKDDAGPNDWTLMMLLDSPFDGGGLVLAGHTGEVCQYLVFPKDHWEDLLYEIQEKRA